MKHVLPLTLKEKQVLDFIRQFMGKKGVAPTYQEIKDRFGFASFFSVQRYLKQLEQKGYVKSPWQNKKRALILVEESLSLDSKSIEVPLLGRVAAGRPIEAVTHPETIDVPSSLVPSRAQGTVFALRVVGDSMIEDGIHEGDVLIIQKQAHAQNGQTVVALIESEATVKRFYRHKDHVELRPANPLYTSMKMASEQVTIQGIVVGLLRRFE